MARWLISVGVDYGSFLFEGNETEAEAMRASKANWEHAVARKLFVPDLTSLQRQGLECANGAAGFLDATLMHELVQLGVCEWVSKGPGSHEICPSPLGKWLLEHD